MLNTCAANEKALNRSIWGTRRLARKWHSPNDAAGNVKLGHVTFKQPSDLDDAEIDGQGLRTKTFAYRVSESGSVDGVVNDATATRTFTVRVV